LVAAKLAAIRNYEYPEIQRQIEERPRLVELLWFVQAMSLRPGGLAKFAEEILAELPERLGTPTMRKAAVREYTLEEKISVWNEMPGSFRPYVPQEEEDFLLRLLPNWESQDLVGMEARNRAELGTALRRFNAALFQEECRNAALQRLPSYLFALCTEKGRKFGQNQGLSDEEVDEVLHDGAYGVKRPSLRRGWTADESWFFDDILGGIIEMMDRRSGQAQRQLAMTEVATRVFDTLDYGMAEKVMVRIEGPSRFGKTEALKAWCDMRPGLARLVRVPCDNSMNSFFKRIAEALGIDCSYGSNVSRLKERIEYVIQHSGLFLVLDEGAFLIPQNYTETTAPHRLNWVRTEIVDRNLPVAIAVTPQAFESAVSRFLKKTHYAMEQFFGRTFRTCRLPDALSEADMIAVAKIHFPDMDEDALGYIASEARLSQNYLQAVEGIAKLARWKAARANRRLGLKDLKAAVAEVLSRETPAAQDGGDSDGERAHVSGRINAPLKAASRPVKPATRGGAEAAEFPACSLRGAGPGTENAELVSADS
jgi:hypothetical protein